MALDRRAARPHGELGQQEDQAPLTATAPRARWPWLVWIVVGLTAWIGGTVLAAASVDEPEDAAGRVLGVFAGGGGAFFAVTFAGAAIGVRRQPPSRYRRLAYVYVGFGVATTALVLLGIGLADDRLLGPLLWSALVLVVVWSVIARWALSSLPDCSPSIEGNPPCRRSA